MSITATNKSSTRELIPAGNYLARCYSMVHLGTTREFIMGQDKILNKVRITWELPTELRTFNEEKGEQPMAISKEYTLSMHEKSNLRKDLESWRGKGFTEDESNSFDISTLLGVPCMLSVIHKTSKVSGMDYATISGIAAMPKGQTCPEQMNRNFEFNFEDMFDEDVLEGLPDFIKEKIKKSAEYRQKANPENVEDNEPTNDLPF